MYQKLLARWTSQTISEHNNMYKLVQTRMRVREKKKKTAWIKPQKKKKLLEITFALHEQYNHCRHWLKPYNNISYTQAISKTSDSGKKIKKKIK